MMFTLQQVLDLQWMVYEGYEIRVTDTGRIMYKDSDFKIKDRDEAELDVTDLFFANTDTAALFGDRLSDFMGEHHCPECEQYLEVAEIQPTDKDAGAPHDQMCSDCISDWADGGMDPYALRGLHRSDFY